MLQNDRLRKDEQLARIDYSRKGLLKSAFFAPQKDVQRRFLEGRANLSVNFRSTLQLCPNHDDWVV
jgi:hypothetical protein